MPHDPRNDLTAEFVRSILDYNPETGEFRWRHNPNNPTEWNTRHAGTIAGCRMGNGYWFIAIKPHRYLGHRLAWLCCHGHWPANQIDHINQQRADNRIANLREVTRSQNYFNTAKRRRNASGFKGVRFHKLSGLWHATIMVNRRTISLKYHRTPEEASEAYKEAARRYHGEYIHSSVK